MRILKQRWKEMKIAVRKRKIGNIPVLEVVPEHLIYEPLPLIIYYHGWQK